MTATTLLREHAAAAYLQLSPTTLRSWRCAEKGPSYRKFGAAVRYSLADLDTFISNSEVGR
jgi:hypothetical protein